ncbi:hypothetical protein [Fischerella thermalis]|uniref:hypothetical protein n=1 Tax=Fischerella thermalis TaxID=372787 RepID=UPI0026837138
MPSPMTTSNSSSVSDTATAWHTIEIEESLLLLDSDRNVGLTNQQAIGRLQAKSFLQSLCTCCNYPDHSITDHVDLCCTATKFF